MSCFSKSRRIRAVVMLLGCAFCAASLSASEVHAKKPIIIFLRAFAPVGQVNFPGTAVKLILVGDAAEGKPGDHIKCAITVVQPGTGAIGVGMAQANYSNSRAPLIANVRLVPGSPRFQPGPVIATTQAVYIQQNQPVRTWSWTSNIALVR